ncbi:methyltransferase [Cadophora sp. MPI-SDFR-AT-0126]|nr:methyltransferase [Leotiomycetes sp. MPI-SDFR-AT-0126]
MVFIGTTYLENLLYLHNFTVMPAVQSNVHFLARDSVYEKEKPNTLRYPSEDDLPQTNFRVEKHEDITFHDIRGQESSFSYEKNGFTIAHLDSKMAYTDFANSEMIKNVFLKEVSTMLQSVLEATTVQALEYIIRKRHCTFPISTGQTYHYNQPTSVAHIDSTPSCTTATVKNRNGENASEFLQQRYQCVNIWKPLKGPLRDWPLGLCDPTTVEADSDLRAADIVYSEYVVENYQVHFTPEQKWYYLDNQLPSEVIVFRQSDSDMR